MKIIFHTSNDNNFVRVISNSFKFFFKFDAFKQVIKSKPKSFLKCMLLNIFLLLFCSYSSRSLLHTFELKQKLKEKYQPILSLLINKNHTFAPRKILSVKIVRTGLLSNLL